MSDINGGALREIPLPSEDTLSAAMALSDSGPMASYYQSVQNGHFTSSAFIYTAGNGGLTVIETLGGTKNAANGAKNRGQVVGSSSVSQAGVMNLLRLDLNSLRLAFARPMA